MSDRDIQKRYNRDDDLKPGRPPRMAQEPKGSDPSVRSPKTKTDPVSGAPQPGAPAPNRSESDERDSQR